MVKSIRVSSEARNRLPSWARQWYIMAKWIKEQGAELSRTPVCVWDVSNKEII